jgi:hypothetical protein
MQFTYELSSTDAVVAKIARVRLELGDTQFNAGVKPDGSNFSDEEITIWLEEEDSDVLSAVGRACKTLARLWTNVANTTVGPRKEELGQVAKGWSDRAKEIAGSTDSLINDSSYAVTVVPVTQKHDPYKFVPEDLTGL